MNKASAELRVESAPQSQVRSNSRELNSNKNSSTEAVPFTVFLNGAEEATKTKEISDTNTQPSNLKATNVDKQNKKEEPTPPALRSDLNSDGVVDAQDLNIILSLFSKNNADNNMGDINGDGAFNFFDLLQLLNDFGAGSANELDQDN
jgi:hypothetical protein